MKLSFGFERDAGEPISYITAAVMKDIGFSSIMLSGAPSAINPQIGIWDWHPLDNCITNCRKAGLEVKLKFGQWVPAHATLTGSITYLPYSAGAAPWRLDADGLAIPGSSKFDPTLPWTKEPAHIDPAWVTDFTYRAMMRYVVNPLNRQEAAVIQEFVCGNEPDDGTYWPAVATKPLDEAFERYVTEWLNPFIFGIKKAQAKLENYGEFQHTWTINGPEAAYVDGLRRLLHSSANSFDHIAFHAYAENLEQALKTLDERIAICKEFNRTDISISEIGDNGDGWMLDYIEAVAKRKDITWLNWNNDALTRLIVEENSNSVRLTDEGYKLQQMWKNLRSY